MARTESIGHGTGFSNRRSRSIPQVRREADAPARIDPVRVAAIVTVIGGLVFNALLCLVNTRFMGMADRHVIMSELAIVGCAFLAAMTRKSTLYVILGVFVS